MVPSKRFWSSRGFIDPATVLTLGILASTILITVITANFVSQNTENRTPAFDQYTTPSPTPISCTYGPHGTYACSSSTSCVQCVNGISQSTDRSKCVGLPCYQGITPTVPPTPTGYLSCSWGPHLSFACSSSTTCVQCVNGTAKEVNRSNCVGKPCYLAPPTNTPTPSRPPTVTPTPACIAQNGWCGPGSSTAGCCSGLSCQSYVCQPVSNPTSTPRPSPTWAPTCTGSCYWGSTSCSTFNRYSASGSCNQSNSAPVACCGDLIPVPTKTPTPRPSSTPRPSPTWTPTCTSPNNCYWGSTSCATFGRYSASGACAQSSSAPVACCGGLIPIPTKTPSPTPGLTKTITKATPTPTTAKLANGQTCGDNSQCVSNNCQWVPGGRVCAPAGQAIPTSQPLPTQTPRPTPVPTTPACKATGEWCGFEGGCCTGSCVGWCIGGSATPTPTVKPPRSAPTPYPSPTPVPACKEAGSLCGLDSSACCSNLCVGVCIGNGAPSPSPSPIPTKAIAKATPTPAPTSVPNCAGYNGWCGPGSTGGCCNGFTCANGYTCSSTSAPTPTTPPQASPIPTIAPTISLPPELSNCTDIGLTCGTFGACCNGLSCQKDICAINYSQKDDAWQYITVLNNTFKTFGCGPTILASLFSTYVDPTWTPDQVWNQYFSDDPNGLIGYEQMIDTFQDQNFEVQEDRNGIYAFGNYLNEGWYGWLIVAFPEGGEIIPHHTTATESYTDDLGNHHIKLEDPYFGAMDCKIESNTELDCQKPDGSHIDYRVDGKYRVMPPEGQ